MYLSSGGYNFRLFHKTTMYITSSIDNMVVKNRASKKTVNLQLEVTSALQFHIQYSVSYF